MSSPRIAAIGDVHGRSDLLARLLADVERAWRADRVVLLGDYIDRGPDSRGVLEVLLDARLQWGPRVVCVRGNHEDWFLDTVRGESSPRGWLTAMEGLATVRSYAPDVADEFARAIAERRPRDHYVAAFAAFVRERFPPAHLRLLESLGTHHVEAGAIFVHAGLAPLVPLERQDPRDLTHIGRAFVERYEGPETVIFGHMDAGALRGDGLALPYVGANRIVGLDTSSAGVLTAYLWPDGDVLQVR